MTGTICFYDSTRGYGFLRNEAYPEDIFFHRTQLHTPGNVYRRTIETGTRVVFELGRFNDRPCALNVAPVSDSATVVGE